MNYALFCNKGEIKQYREFFKSAANSTLLAAESVLTTDKIDQIKDEYNPHGIIIAGMEIADVKTAVKYVSETYNDLKTILIYPDIKKDDLEELQKYTESIITRPITTEDFTYIIDNNLGAYEIEILNQKKPGKKLSVKNDRGKLSLILNIKTIAIAAVAVTLIFLLLAVSTCSNDNSGDSESTEAVETTATEVTEAETETEPKIEIFTTPTLPTQPTQESTAATSATIPNETPTEKATEKPAERENAKSSNFSSQSQITQSGQTSSAPVQTPQTPVYEEVVTDPPAVSSQPYTPPQSSTPVIVDDGKIYLDPTSITMSVGDTCEIYVSGLSAANGCNWDVQNAAVADFVSGDTTKVTVKATGVGVTVITATSKSSGATAQCVITVKR